MPATTAREIVGRASANLASIPYHFGTKDALVAEALIAEARELVAPVLNLLAGDRPAAERARQAVAMLDEVFEASRPQVPVYLAALAAAPAHARRAQRARLAVGRPPRPPRRRHRTRDRRRARYRSGCRHPPWLRPSSAW